MGSILARRASGIFIAAPIFVPILLVLGILYARSDFSNIRIVCILCCIEIDLIRNFFSRLGKPRTLAEYDEWGITLNMSTSKSVYITKREAITALPTEDEAEGSVYAMYGLGLFNFKVTNYTFGLLKTGLIQIHTKYGRYKISGVDNVVEAAPEINKLLRKWRDEYENEIVKNIEKQHDEEEQARIKKMEERLDTYENWGV